MIRKEGYIKYRSHLLEWQIPELEGFEELNRCRTELFDLRLLGAYPDGVGYGNVSMRVDAGRFIITGSATGAVRELGRDHYVLVESFDLKENSVRAVGRINPSAESMSHGAVYRARSGVGCVIHIHSRALFDYMRREGYWETDPAIPFGTPELASAINDLVLSMLGDEGVFVTAGHDEGIIAFGRDVAAAKAMIMSVYEKGAAE